MGVCREFQFMLKICIFKRVLFSVIRENEMPIGWFINYGTFYSVGMEMSFVNKSMHSPLNPSAPKNVCTPPTLRLKTEECHQTASQICTSIKMLNSSI